MPLLDFLPLLGLLAVLWLGGRQVISGDLSVGSFVAFNAYVVMLVWPLRVLGQRVTTLQKALGSNVETTFKELVPEGPQTCQVIESLVRDGNKIIFATSFGFQDCMVSEATRHPDVKFEQATGTAQSSRRLASRAGCRPTGSERRAGRSSSAATCSGRRSSRASGC